MVHISLWINKQKLTTLEELRENFILAELLERFHSRKLRTWLHNREFKAELKQLDELPSDLPEAELAEALCRIFGIKGRRKKQALADFQNAQAKREQEAKHRLEQQEAEEQRKAEQNRPLTLDELEFDWQEAEGPKVELLASGANRFVAIPDRYVRRNLLFSYSYDGLHWQEVAWPQGDFYAHKFYHGNSYFIILREKYWGMDFHYSSDSVHWKTAKIDGDIQIEKIIWADGHYVALCTQSDTLYYTEKVLFMDVGKTASWERPVVYTAPDLAGPWRKEEIGGYRSGDSLTDVIFFKGNFIFTGNKAYEWMLFKNYTGEQLYYAGSSINKLKLYFLGRNTKLPSKVWSGNGKCFRCAWGGGWSTYDSARTTEDGSHWSEIKYGMTDFLDAQRFLVARLVSLDLSSVLSEKWGYSGKDIGFHISLDGVNWKKLDAPLQNGKMAYLAGKLLIADGNKLAIGTVRIRQDKEQRRQLIAALEGNAQQRREEQQRAKEQVQHIIKLVTGMGTTLADCLRGSLPIVRLRKR